MKKPRKKVNIRCRKCWVDVAVQKIGELLKPCPLCGQKETYEHSYPLPKTRQVKVKDYLNEVKEESGEDD